MVELEMMHVCDASSTICRHHLAAGLIILFATCASSDVRADDPDKLWAAAKSGNADEVLSLLDAGTDVDAKTKYGATALSFAAERGHLEVAKLLIERGADVNNQDTFYGYTPRTWAQFGGHTEVVSLLEEHGGTLNIGNSASAKKVQKSEQKGEQPEAKAESTEPKSDEAGGEDTSQESAPEQPAFEFPKLGEQEILEDDLACSSANWPQFRGQGARGVADGQAPPASWDGTDENQRNLAWKVNVPGLGNSSPVIWNDRIYLTTAISEEDDQGLKTGYYGSVTSVDDDSEHAFVVICFDAQTGSEVWRETAVQTPPFVKRHLKSTHADPTVATDGTHLIACFGAQGLYCYDLDGALIWKNDLGELDSGWFYDPDYQWEFGSSPIIHNGLAIVQCDVQQDSFLAAFELATGKEVWRTERDEIPSWGTPTAYDTPSGPLLFTNATREMRCYYADTGQLAWSFAENSEITAPTPFVAYDTVFMTAGYRPIQPIRAITLSARGDLTLPDGETQSQFVRWSTRKGGPYLPTPIAYRGHLYVCNNAGILTCYDAQDGEQLYRERLETPGQRSFVGSSVAADGRLYFTAEDGNVLVVSAGAEFELLGVSPVGASVLSTPSISSGTIYFRTPSHLIAFRADSS